MPGTYGASVGETLPLHLETHFSPQQVRGTEMPTMPSSKSKLNSSARGGAPHLAGPDRLFFQKGLLESLRPKVAAAWPRESHMGPSLVEQHSTELKALQ